VIAPAAIGDSRARQIIATGLDRSLCVEAAAGTGKTTELVNRIVAVLRSGLATIDRIVAVTFTHKAAGELKLRLRQKLDDARDHASGDEAARIELALQHLEDAAIGTIHSFCAQILRERPVEAGIDPAFVEAAEQETRGLYRRAFRSWFEQALEQNPPGLRRALARLAWSDAQDLSATEQLQLAGWKLVEWRDFPAPWARLEFDREREINEVVQAVVALAGACACCKKRNDNLVRSLAPVRELATWIERSAAAGARDYDTIEALLVKLPRDMRRDTKKGSGFFAEGVLRERVVQMRDQLFMRLDQFRRRAEADLAALLQAEMRGLVDRYGELKSRAGRLDFTDLLIRARDLVRDNAEVRSWLQRRFSHIFVDEFQDTDPLQAELLVLLSSEDPEQDNWFDVTPVPGKLFIVGDPKQSIYRFRRADVLLYQEIRNRLTKRGVELVYLTRSFRSVEPLQSCINAAFAPEMVEDITGAQAGYVPLEKKRDAIDRQPAIVALPAPRPYGSARVNKEKIAACLPDTIAAYTDWLVNESGWKICGEDGELRPIREGDIVILFRRFINQRDDVTRPYVRALEAREIRHLLVGSKSFHEREEVETVRSACQAIEWPDDELAVYATLHGSLFALTDNLLLRFRSDVGRLHPLSPRGEECIHADFRPVTEALEILKDLHWGRNRRAIADTLNSLLESTRAHAGFAFRPGGNQVLGNVYRVVDLARAFESGGGLSFRGFVDELNARAERTEIAESPLVEEAAEGVRLMTVHAAKGLEFPVVILADMNANIQSGDPERYIETQRRLCATRLLWCAPHELVENDAIERERDRAEGVRVAYVAATRARDLLVIPVVGDEERQGWLGPLNKAVYPRPDRWRWATVPAGCPSFGYRTVLERPIDYERGEEISVRPGAHRAREGTHEVVWWDPAVLRLNVEEKFGLPGKEMLKEDGGDSAQDYDAWRSKRAALIESGAQPSIRVFTPSEAGEGPPDFAPEVAYESTARDPGRPAGRRFGSLVHGLLRDALFETASVRKTAGSLARVVGATPEEVEAAVRALEEASRHPLIARARRAARIHRELPLMYRLEDGRLLEGVADLAFLEDGAWTLIDFKTDADLAPRRTHYESQLRWYALALTRLTGQPVRCVLFGI
jgi:ATP-dependent exoDNAse (exonuclease V) beta subunit